MVHDGADASAGPASLDSVHVQFDEQRLISDAGLLLTATLADQLGIEETVNESVWLGHAGSRRGAAGSQGALAAAWDGGRGGQHR